MLRILVASDIRLFREGVAARLAEVGEVQATSSSEDPDTLLRIMRESPPDALLIQVGSSATLDSIRAVAREMPTIPIVALGVPEDERVVIPCAEAGVSGYVPAAASLSELVDAVAGAVRGEAIMSPLIAGSLVRHINTLASTSPSTHSSYQASGKLTAREREVARLIEEGLSNKQIARRLGIGLATVKNHVHSILGKLHVDRRGKVALKLRERRSRTWFRGWRT